MLSNPTKSSNAIISRCIRTGSNIPPKPNIHAFTYVELVVALAIGAVVLTISVVSYRAILGNGLGRAISEDVALPNGAFFDFYGTNSTYVSVSRAPNYGNAAMAESMRERLHEDVSTAIAVFCLGRNARSTIRPSTIAVATNFDARTLISPEAFRTYLATVIPASASVFSSFLGTCTTTNSSLFILNASTNTGEINVRAVYETDMVTTTSPPGVYATVRRYEGSTFTDYYHVFYADQTNSFTPLAAYFERDALTFSGITAVDRNKKAANRPFYFVWWPDPAAPRLDSDAPSETIPASEPRAGYANMAGRTSFFFVIPAFPPL